MLGFRRMKTLQRFTSVHGSVHNHCNPERHLIIREDFEERRFPDAEEAAGGALSAQVFR
jgi:hypothetical protein